MIRLRHILHPIRSAKSLCRRVHSHASTYFYKRIGEREFGNIARGQRDKCWCSGELLPFKWHNSYGVCAECGCYVNRRPPLPEELQRLYSLDLYWHTRQKLKGYPTIEQRPVNDRADGRVQCWLELIERYGPARGRVVEVGCAHGVLLAELKSRNYDCLGVEPDEQTAEWTRQKTGLDIRAGFFPGVPLPRCDLFLAFDVIEHVSDPLAFLQGAGQLLPPGGVAILQTPIDRHARSAPPFGEMFEKVFDDIEHQFVFVDKSMQRLGRQAGFRVLAQTAWCVAHEIVVFEREE